MSGLHFVVDVNTLELLEIEDAGPTTARGRWASTSRGWSPASGCATTSSRCEITQPEGVSFTLEGNLLRWQRWSMRLGFNPREGARDPHARLPGRRPPAADRAPALVRRDGRPYRDPTHDHKARTAFDIGEWGLGFMTTSLELGLRLPWRDRLPRRRRARRPRASRGRSATRSASTRRTTPSSGSTSTRWPARRCGARAGWSSPSTPPSPTTSTSSTGASTRTATSSARCAPPGSWSRATSPRGAAALRDARRRAHLRAVPPALHRRAARPRRRRRATTPST